MNIENARDLMPRWQDPNAWIILEALIKERLEERTTQIFGALEPRDLMRMKGAVTDVFDQMWDQGVLVIQEGMSFFGFCAHAMRGITVNLRKRIRPKRGDRKSRSVYEAVKSSLTFPVLGHLNPEEPLIDVLVVNRILKILDKENFELGKIMELKYFEQLTLDEMTIELNLTKRQLRTKITKAEEKFRAIWQELGQSKQEGPR